MSGSRSTRSRPLRSQPQAPATCSRGRSRALIARGMEPFAATCAAVLRPCPRGAGGRRRARRRVRDRDGRGRGAPSRSRIRERRRCLTPEAAHARGRARRPRCDRAQLPRAPAWPDRGHRALRRGQGRRLRARRGPCAERRPSPAARAGWPWRPRSEAAELRAAFPDTPILTMGALSARRARAGAARRLGDHGLATRLRRGGGRARRAIGVRPRLARQVRQRHGPARERPIPRRSGRRARRSPTTRGCGSPASGPTSPPPTS